MKGLTVPQSLIGNLKNLQSNGSVFRDKTTGKMFDAKGDPLQAPAAPSPSPGEAAAYGNIR